MRASVRAWALTMASRGLGLRPVIFMIPSVGNELIVIGARSRPSRSRASARVDCRPAATAYWGMMFPIEPRITIQDGSTVFGAKEIVVDDSYCGVTVRSAPQ